MDYLAFLVRFSLDGLMNIRHFELPFSSSEVLLINALTGSSLGFVLGKVSFVGFSSEELVMRNFCVSGCSWIRLGN